jgi:hypothetical protein
MASLLGGGQLAISILEFLATSEILRWLVMEFKFTDYLYLSSMLAGSQKVEANASRKVSELEIDSLPSA